MAVATANGRSGGKVGHVDDEATTTGKTKSVQAVIRVKKISMVTAKFRLTGTAPLLQARFSAKAMQAMRAKQEAGQQAAKGKEKKARDFESDFQNAMHVSEDGWVGVPAAAIRNACIDVCRMVGYKMTFAKMSIFVNADGTDRVDGMPLIKLIAGKPEKTEMAVRNATGVADIRVRPMWRTWSLIVSVKFDVDQFSLEDVCNLLQRAGVQIGLGEGRPFSKDSNGMGYGTFDVKLVND